MRDKLKTALVDMTFIILSRWFIPIELG